MMRNRKPAVLLIGDDENGNAASRQILEREGCAAHGVENGGFKKFFKGVDKLNRRDIIQDRQTDRQTDPS